MAKASILITGANGGLGSAIVAHLLTLPQARTHHGIYTVRDPARASTLHTILASAPSTHTYEILTLDLTTLASVRTFAASINARVAAGTLPPIGALVLNAAWQEANAQTLSPQSYTADGFESAFAINYLANFVLVLLGLGSLDAEGARIVMITSRTHDAFSPDNGNNFKGEGDKFKVMFTDTQSLADGIKYTDGTAYDAGMRRYGASKLLMVMFMYELQRRLDADPKLANISVVTVDPGAMSTPLTKRSPWGIFFLVRILLPLLQDIMMYFQPNGFIRTTKKSARDTLRACFDEETLGRHPKAVFLDGELLVESSKESRDVTKQKVLWADSVKLADIKDGETVLQNWR